MKALQSRVREEAWTDLTNVGALSREGLQAVRLEELPERMRPGAPLSVKRLGARRGAREDGLQGRPVRGNFRE